MTPKTRGRRSAVAEEERIPIYDSRHPVSGWLRLLTDIVRLMREIILLMRSLEAPQRGEYLRDETGKRED
ncbi:MAG: hypothetical protein ACUVXI_13405 [bacterium]